MPNPTRWHIEDPHGLLAEDGETRRMVRMFKELHGTDIPTALAELVKAGYQQLVSTPLPPKLHGPNPRGATDGSSTLEDR